MVHMELVMDNGNVNNRKEKAWVLAVAFLVLSGVLIVHSSYYMPFLSDDSLISLRYLHRFLHGDGLTWTDGIRVEGYSNLSWILLLACLGIFNVDLIVAARILGIAGMAVVMLSTLLWYTRTNTLRQIWLPLAAGLLFFCLAAPTAVWAIGGLEQPLYAALLAIAIPLCFAVIESDNLNLKKTLLASLTLGLMCITRPDGPIFTVAAIAAFLLSWRYSEHKRPLHTVLVLLVFPALFYAGQTVFRLYYYGEIVPNTAFAKFTPSFHHFIAGMQYVAYGMLSLAPFSLIAVVSLIISLRSQQTRGRAILLLAMTFLWLSYVAAIGGDIFPAWRHFIPVIVIFTFAVIEGSLLACRHIEKKNASNRPVLAAGFVVLFVVYLVIQFNDPRNKLAVLERWEWDGKNVGLLLKRAFSKQQPLIAVTAAGCLPYWSELPSLDMLGLNDYYLPRHPPKDLGQGYIGHELGSGRYVLEREPDIIIFHVGLLRDNFRSGQEMQQTDEFYKNYAPIKVLIPDRRLAILWVRKYSNKIGMHQTPYEIEVPGFLLNANPDTFAYLNSRDKLVVSTVVGQPVGIDITVPSSEEWSCKVKASEEGVDCHMKRQGLGSKIMLETSSYRPVEIEKLVLNRDR